MFLVATLAELQTAEPEQFASGQRAVHHRRIYRRIGLAAASMRKCRESTGTCWLARARNYNPFGPGPMSALPNTHIRHRKIVLLRQSIKLVEN